MPAALPLRCGIGLKWPHAEALLADPSRVGFVEVHAENLMVDGGAVHRRMTAVRERLPLSLHGVGLSIGGEAPLDEAHLERLAALVARYEPAVFSEHLAWSSHGGACFGDLLPLPLNEATLARVADHVDRLQTRLARRVLIENPSTYVEFADSTLGEAEFLTALVRRTGCGLLVDVNNAHVSAVNHGRDARTLLAALPADAIGQIHLAGFATEADADGAPLLIDTHSAPVDDAVWALYAELIARIGSRPTLLERDHDVPPLPVLVAEARRAEQVMRGLAAPRTARPAASRVAA